MREITMANDIENYTWPNDDILLEPRNMVAIRRFDDTHIAICERAWPDGDAEVVVALEDLPKLIARLHALHEDWVNTSDNRNSATSDNRAGDPFDGAGLNGQVR
jgi:hypothetical protein